MYTYLNTDTNRELSKLLHEKGVISNSEYWHIKHTDSIGQEFIECKRDDDVDDHQDDFICPAYTLEDCLRGENAIKIWGEKWDISFKTKIPDWQNKSLEVLDLYQRGYDWQQFIINHLKGEHNV